MRICRAMVARLHAGLMTLACSGVLWGAAWAQPAAPAPGDWTGAYTCSSRATFFQRAGEVFSQPVRLTLRNGELTGYRERDDYIEKFSGSIDAAGHVTLAADGFWARAAGRFTTFKGSGSRSGSQVLVTGEQTENNGSSVTRTLDCVVLLSQSEVPEPPAEQASSAAVAPDAATTAAAVPQATTDGTWAGNWRCQPAAGADEALTPFFSAVRITVTDGRVSGNVEAGTEQGTFYGTVGRDGAVKIETVGQTRNANRFWTMVVEGAVDGNRLRASGQRVSSGSLGPRQPMDCSLDLARQGPAPANAAVTTAALPASDLPPHAGTSFPAPAAGVPVTAPAPLTRRRALVIGNDRYQHVTPLVNARADARAIGEALQRQGFTVTTRTDVDERGFKQVLRDFRAEVAGGDEVVLFFAGHGVQLGGANYLLPVDIRGDGAEQVKDESLPLQRILDDFADRRAGFLLAIVDACRDNPFRGMGRAIGGRGLAPTTAATGQMVIFSAGSGQQALDRLGPTDSHPNGLFTRVFLREMEKPDLPVDRVLRNVRNEVVRLARSVGHEQTPALYDQAIGDFFLSRSR